MRASISALLLLAACGADPGEPAPAPMPTPTSPPPTALALTVDYDKEKIVTLKVTGAAGTAIRKFGPYEVAAKELPSGGSIGLVFDALDAGASMVCVSTHEAGGQKDEDGCTMFDLRAGEITTAHLDIRDLH